MDKIKMNEIIKEFVSEEEKRYEYCTVYTKRQL